MNNQTSTARVALKWGLITGITLVLYSTILYTLDQATNRGLSLVIYGILIVGLILGMREYRSANEGYMSFGDGMSLGTLLSAIAGFLSSLFTIFYTNIIDPGFQERLTEQVREQMEEQGNMSDEQVDQAVDMMQKFQSPGITFAVGIFMTILIGVIFSLVIAAFIRKNKTNPFE
ncbi:DUF4199 domain-containing protein [Spirosoma sp. KCTC 42546]|uniref:DUF4199 domain-containing protein n=1 Tax=Spirosoma sp. KCTC 42546 TaxID=2520506 RepID=UPI001159305B|nr:DUF4199 domain-containing protein [Spirosoma sp. KCTC 42546]QDK82735.1 DUF4199 domain-containing protein [Spirosoma sp. KCTC 42546]